MPLILRKVLKWVGIGLAVIIVTGAALFAFGLRVVLYGGGTPRLQFVESERTRSERLARSRAAQRGTPAGPAASIVDATATAPPAAESAPRAAPAAAGATRAVPAQQRSFVSIFDNAFHRGQDRPTVRLHAGGTLTWRWRSQQSHQVTLRSGPRPLVSPTKTAGQYSVQLDKPGRYTFVCSIHAPGMRMSAIVE